MPTYLNLSNDSISNNGVLFPPGVATPSRGYHDDPDLELTSHNPVSRSFTQLYEGDPKGTISGLAD